VANVLVQRILNIQRQETFSLNLVKLPHVVHYPFYFKYCYYVLYFFNLSTAHNIVSVFHRCHCRIEYWTVMTMWVWFFVTILLQYVHFSDFQNTHFWWTFIHSNATYRPQDQDVKSNYNLATCITCHLGVRHNKWNFEHIVPSPTPWPESFMPIQSVLSVSWDTFRR
jgi:hypothetical protein